MTTPAQVLRTGFEEVGKLSTQRGRFPTRVHRAWFSFYSFKHLAQLIHRPLSNRGSLLSCLFFLLFPLSFPRHQQSESKGFQERVGRPYPAGAARVASTFASTGLQRRPLSALPPSGGVGERLRLAAK